MRTQLLAAAAAALTISLTGAATASATTFNASPGSTRTQTPCTAAQPCKLTFAVDQAFSGDDVALVAGTYDYFGADPLAVRPGVVLHGAPGARAKIEQTAPYRDCDGCSTLELNGGATLRDVDVSQVEGAGAVEVTAGGVVIERSALRGRSRALTFADTDPNGASVEAREVLAFASDGVAVAAQPGGATRYLENVTAVGEGPVGRGISVVSGAGRDATLDAVNTIARGSAYDVEAYAKPWGTSDGAGINDVATLRMRYGNYRGGDKANEQTSDPAWPNARIEGWDHNLPDDPKFVSATDFHLADGSPAIDQGRSSGLLGTLDLDGFTRSFGAKPDVGAYEWHPAPPKQDDDGSGQPAPGTDDQQPQQPGGPVQPQQPTQPTQPTQPAQPAAARVVIARQTVTVKKNVAAVKVECPAGATAGCQGTLALSSGKVKVGSARYSLAAGKRGVVKVKLGKAARKLIARKRKLKATATASDAKAAITLKLPARRR
jgi:hypothetical protein